MSLLIGIQSRLASTRFPRKAFHNIAGIPLIVRVIQRTVQIRHPHTTALLVPKQEKQEFIDFLHSYNINICVFGSHEIDVLARYKEAADFFNAEQIMRVTGDNPLISIRLAEQLIDLHTHHDLSHFIGNPLGSGVEVISKEALNISFQQSHDDFEREHVTQYIYRNPTQFSILEPIFPQTNYNSLSIDQPDDIPYIEKILTENPNWDLI